MNQNFNFQWNAGWERVNPKLLSRRNNAYFMEQHIIILENALFSIIAASKFVSCKGKLYDLNKQVFLSASQKCKISFSLHIQCI